MGQRVQSAKDGMLGPIIARWINASVSPIASRLRLAAEAYLSKDYFLFASILDSPLFGLAEAMSSDNAGNGLVPVLKWCLKGTSPGREGSDVTYCEDLVLAALGAVISTLATAGIKATKDERRKFVTLSQAIGVSALAARETGMGQFLTQVQGAQAMLRIRRKDRSAWAQTDRMNAIAGMMLGQVKPTLDSADRHEIDLGMAGGKTVLKVSMQTKGGERTSRRLTLRKPTADDWAFMGVAAKLNSGSKDEMYPVWCTFALLVIAAAQAEHGWFDLTKDGRNTKQKYPVRYLEFSEEAYRHLRHDLDKWLHMGFQFDPMVCPPVGGDYLTVQHKAIAGPPGPHAIRTSAYSEGEVGPEPTSAWNIACEVMAGSPFVVADETLTAINTREEMWTAAHKSYPGDEDTFRRVLGEYGRVAGFDEVYLPIYMDFRGRVYRRTTWVTEQGTDLQKGLLKFPTRTCSDENYDREPLVQHACNLWGNGVEKWDRKGKWEFYQDQLMRVPAHEAAAKAESPVQMYTFMTQFDEEDSSPCQIDGTCNGLQHLSALFRDEEAAPWVNLNACSMNGDSKSDIYGEVAGRVGDKMVRRLSIERGHDMENKTPGWEPWMARLRGVTIDRKVCKRPVMVLPYGGTLNAIEEAVSVAILDQQPDATPWTTGAWADQSYLAFKDRPLKEHPLFKSDMRMLAGLIYGTIKGVIPKAMDAMDAFREIAGKVGERTLEWDTGFGSNPLWIVHAYAKSQRRTNIFRGLHFPNSVRGLTMRTGKDEIDPASHRTGIVANFIHSQDAAHLVATMSNFRLRGGTNFGAIHDCLLGRPSEMHHLNAAVREAFHERYRENPLNLPVRMRDPMSGKVESYDTWWLLARDLGVTLPDLGKWEPDQVLRSEWFFS